MQAETAQFWALVEEYQHRLTSAHGEFPVAHNESVRGPHSPQEIEQMQQQLDQDFNAIMAQLHQVG